MILHIPFHIVSVLACVSIITGCTAIPLSNQQITKETASTPVCSFILLEGLNDKVQIQEIVKAEGALTVAQDIDALMALWSEDGLITDAKHTPDIATDDQQWQGQDAIRYRYVRVVFPSAPLLSMPSTTQITVNENNAEVISTTHIGEEISPNGDVWILTKIEGCWYIKSLTFNREPLHP